MPVEDVDQRVSVRNYLELVPVAYFDVGLKIIGASQGRKQTRMLALAGFYHLASPGDDSPAAALLVELPGVLVVVIEISLIALHVPFGIVHLLVRARRSKRTTVLNASIGAGALQLHLHFEHEVGRLAAFPDDVGRPRWMLRARLADYAAILHVPYFAGAIPPI